MKLHFFGTGAGVPSKKRNVSSFALQLLQYDGSVWLFDCGEATQHQILHTHIKPRKIEKIFITHLHGDHIYGLPGLLSSRSFQEGRTPVQLYGPKGIKEYIDVSLQVSQTRLAYPLEIIELKEGILLENDHFTVTAKLLAHGVPSYGFLIEEKPTIGELLPKKLQAAGIAPGPIYKKIKENEKTTLPDGRLVKRADFIGPSKRGKRIAIFGDTRYIREHAEFAKNADVIVHEATFAPGEGEMAYEYFHSTASDAANLAKDAKAKHLILTHISSRYQDEQTKDILEKTKKIFSQTTIVNDLDEIDI
ncbi:ribonuclease Z [Salirhabdus salicampi]|uniref:ribonuclease Z n=1 Tax=Salirhabdus salicampi TaxID=476102 RepID=UPI0020C4734C|nr:ribonuclease Z [Salirhabdus salicampi]MCP8616785.1 ribonuclease Z [Salirhabdus salicampi]